MSRSCLYGDEFAYGAMVLTCTYVILLGVILALGAEVKERGKLLSSKSIQVEDARTLLHQYSEWWDSTGNELGSEMTHDDLVAAFIKSRSPYAIPQLYEGEPMPDIADLPTGTPLDMPPYQEHFSSGTQELRVLPDPPVVFNPRAESALSALEYATRWASMVEPNVPPEDIVSAAKQYQKFLEGVPEDASNYEVASKSF